MSEYICGTMYKALSPSNQTHGHLRLGSKRKATLETTRRLFQEEVGMVTLEVGGQGGLYPSTPEGTEFEINYSGERGAETANTVGR